MPVVADTSVWLSWLVDDADAAVFAKVLAGEEPPLVPTIVLYEVSRWFWARGEDARLPEVGAVLKQGQVVGLSSEIAERAAALGARHRLAMADALIYATARLHDAELWTRDADFAGLEGVRYFAKAPARPS